MRSVSLLALFLPSLVQAQSLNLNLFPPHSAPISRSDLAPVRPPSGPLQAANIGQLQDFILGGIAGGVATNAQLTASAVATNLNGILRMDYAAGAGAPPVLFKGSTSPCGITGGDGGSQVPSADGGCWLATGMTTADIREWGANPASGDNAPAINAAITYAMVSGINEVYAPGSGYYASQINLVGPTNTFTIRGSGSTYAPTFRLGTATQIGLNVVADTPVVFRDFSIAGAANPTAGACINLTGQTAQNGYSQFHDVTFSGCWIGVNTVSAAWWKMDSVDMHGIVYAGVVVSNVFAPDNGDSAISNSQLELNPAYTNYGIIQQSSGGLKIATTKILATGSSPSAGTCYWMNLAAGVNTSDFLPTGVSCENVANGYLFTRHGSTGSFIHVELTGLQFAEVTNPIIEQDSGSPWLTALTVAGGSMQVNSGGTGITLGVVGQVSIVGPVILCASGSCTGMTPGTSSGSAIMADYATTPFGSIPSAFTAINTAGGALTINQGGTVGVTCSGTPTSSHATKNGLTTVC